MIILRAKRSWIESWYGISEQNILCFLPFEYTFGYYSAAKYLSSFLSRIHSFAVTFMAILLSKRNKEFRELIAYFPLIRNGSHGRR
jgi:hypothetical protein